jgi:hypothetical protein
MAAGFATTWKRGTRRRLVGLALFWALWALLIGVANGIGAIDATLAVNFVH